MDRRHEIATCRGVASGYILCHYFVLWCIKKETQEAPNIFSERQLDKSTVTIQTYIPMHVAANTCANYRQQHSASHQAVNVSYAL
jgi:hypothetical protein